MREITNQIASIVKDLFDADEQIELTRTEPQFGDFACNVAMRLGKKLTNPPVGGPREVAQKIVDNLKSDSITKAKVAGPGFINITVSTKKLLDLTLTKPSESLKDKTILVEYSDPNPLKPLHAGHLYTTLVGDTIARLVENAGAKTIRINYGGDVGLHVAKSMWAIIKKLGGELSEKLNSVAEANRAGWLGERYVEGNNSYEEDDIAKAEIIAVNKRVYEIHAKSDHDSDFAQIYWTVRGWSYDYFKTLYKQLKVVPFDRFIPESEVTELGVDTVNAQLKKGVFSKSDGAVVFEGEKYGLHTRVFINSNGLPTYEAKDVGLSLTKWQDYKFDESIIITANEQEQYMQVVLKAISQFAPEPAQRTKHLTHGLVKLMGGVKMSSRKGNIVTALEILEAARQAGAETGTNPSESTILAAIKYAFAKNRVGGDIAYDPKESIALEGNSGPYLQYAHARARSILAKSKKPIIQVESLNQGSSLMDLEREERGLLAKISEYTEVVERATADLMPHHICTYLYELAQNFNRFYENNHVIGDERQDERLLLVNYYADALKNGLNLIGIDAPEKM